MKINKQSEKASQQTYKAEIVKEFIEKFPHTGSNAIARMIAKAHPLIWKDSESVRTLVRTYRDGHGGRHEAKRTPEERKHATQGFKIPETDYNEVEHLWLPKHHNDILFLTDVHVPYHDVKSLKSVFKYAEKKGFNTIYLNGDIMDCYGISRFVKDPRARDMAGELEKTKDFLGELKERYNVPMYYKMGNHEDRWDIFLRSKAPELLGIAEIELSNLLLFEEFNITEVKSKQVAKAGNLNMMHGHEFGQSVFSPVSVARGLYTRTKEDTVIGHHHQTSEFTEKSPISGTSVTCHSVGALCGMKPDYMPFNKWNSGFAMIQFDDSGEYELKNKKVVDFVVK